MKTDSLNGHEPAECNNGTILAPRRPIEQTYLQTLNDAVSLDDWQGIVKAAVEQAKAGDSRARAWLTQFLIGPEPPKLIDIQAEALVNHHLDGALIRAVAERIEENDHDRLFKSRELKKAEKLVNSKARVAETIE